MSILVARPEQPVRPALATKFISPVFLGVSANAVQPELVAPMAGNAIEPSDKQSNPMTVADNFVVHFMVSPSIKCDVVATKPSWHPHEAIMASN